MQDYDETLPPASDDDPLTGPPPSPTPWMFMVDPYIKSGYPQAAANQGGRNFGVFVCPDYSKTQVGNAPSHSYYANANLMPSWITATGLTPATAPVMTLASIHSPAKVVLIGEAASGSRIFSTGDDVNIAPASPTNVLAQCQAVYLRGRIRHTDGANSLFADGHVKLFRAPGASFTSTGANWWNVAPITSQSNIVFQQSAFPNAGGWFVKDPNNS